MLKDNKGITITALTITIIVLLILATVGVGGGIVSINRAKDNSAITELSMVQHAVLERYSKYKLTLNDQILVGTQIPFEQAESKAQELNQTIPNEGNYYILEQSDLENLGLSNEKYTYVVNYQKGIVFNYSLKQTTDGQYLFIKANN